MFTHRQLFSRRRHRMVTPLVWIEDGPNGLIVNFRRKLTEYELAVIGTAVIYAYEQGQDQMHGVELTNADMLRLAYGDSERASAALRRETSGLPPTD